MDSNVATNIFFLSKEGIFPPDWIFRDPKDVIVYKKPSKNTITKTTETLVEGRKGRAQCNIHKQPPSLDARITLLPRKGSKMSVEQTVVFQKRHAVKDVYEFEYDGRVFHWRLTDDLLTRTMLCEYEHVDADDHVTHVRVATYEHQSNLDYLGRLLVHKGVFPEVRDPKGLEICIVASFTLYDESIEQRRRNSVSSTLGGR